MRAALTELERRKYIATQNEGGAIVTYDGITLDQNNDEWRNQAPSVFKQLKLADPQRKTASIVSWNTTNHT